jgi:predicted unusual protein kinase regulating ubiquinone biosynthesis (AarF/ABC1/UbiB family)
MRTVVIALRLLPLFLSFRRDFQRWMLIGAPLARDAAFHARRARRVADTIAALGPTFVKLAQVFAARADLIPEPYIGALGTLLDRVPAAPWPEVQRLLATELGAPPERVFEELKPEPLAAGSLGLVYRARAGGEDVVVKVLRPGVERVVARDIVAARRISSFLDRHWPNPHLHNFRVGLEEFALRVDEEMDFRQEAEHAEAIGRAFAGDARVVVPRVLPAFTRRRVLVLEYVEGRRVDTVGDMVASGALDPNAVVRTVIELYVRMMLVDGLFHADPHPGNLLVRRDGRLVLLDFGMVMRVPRETRAHLIRTVLAAIRRDAPGVATGFHALGLVQEGADPVEIVRLVELLLELAYSGASPQDAARVLVEEVMATLYDWPIALTGEMVYFARVAALVEGIGMRWIPGFNSITFAAPVVLRMRREVLQALQETGGASTEEWAAMLGAVAGRTARVLADTGRQMAVAIGAGLAALLDAAAREGERRAPTARPAAAVGLLPERVGGG